MFLTFQYNIVNAQSLHPRWLSRLDRVIIFVNNESEIKRSSPIDGMHFFKFARNKRGLCSRNKRYFELLFSLLITRLKKIIEMPVMEYVLKRVSFGSKDCTKELKLECAYFLGQTI